MGCVESRLERDVHTNIFHVVNIQERGQRQRSSRLEVTDSYLILHHRGRAPISWPLRCLRRYGFDAEQFSFESGRRCPTGPGIYNFKCRRAEALFNMLQLQIQNIADDATSRDIVSIPHNPETRELSRTDSRTSTVTDAQGYLETLPRPLTRPLNSLVGPISSPPLSVAPGANGGVGGIGAFSSIVGIRSPGPPSAPTSPPPAGIFEVSDPRVILPPSVEERDDPTKPPSASGTDSLSKETPSTPTEASRNIMINYTDRNVTYINHNERPSSYSSSGSDRPSSLINHVDRPQSYVNQTERPLSHLKLEPGKSALGLSYSKQEDRSRCRHHLYINVDTDLRRERDHVYANLGLDKDLPTRSSLVPGSGGSGSSHSGTTTTTDTDQQNSQINYIQVDLDRGSDSSQTAPLSPLGSVASVVSDYPRGGVSSSNNMSTRGYATIDFEKTEALTSTAKAVAMWETRADGQRKTRHNSTFTPIPPLGRHNSTLSD